MSSETYEISRQDELIRIAWDFVLEPRQLEHLIEIFRAQVLSFEMGKSEVLLGKAFRQLQDEDPTLHPLKSRNIRSLLKSLRQASLLPDKVYPQERRPKTIDGKVLQRKEAVVAIIGEHFHSGDFLSYLKFYRNTEHAYEAFAAWYNVTSPTRRLPVSWEALSTEVRSSIRTLLGAKHAHHKINDALALRFATREQLLSHLFFNFFFTYYITAERHRWGKSFNTIIRKILIHWDAFFATQHQLKLPVAFLPRRDGEISFQTLLGAKDRKPETILPLLGINPSLWRRRPRKLFTNDPEMYRCFQSNLPLSGSRTEKNKPPK